MSDINTSKVDGNTVSASEFNQLAEIDNLISTSGQTPSTTNLEQISIGSARYSSAGQFYTDGGTANAYVLSPVSPFKSPVSATAGEGYFNGMIIRFRAGNANTGASTVNVNSAGVKNLLKQDGTALSAGDIPSNSDVEFRYNGTSFLKVLGNATATTQGIVYLNNPVTVANNATTPNTDLDFIAGNFAFSDGSGQAISTAMTKRLQSSGAWTAGAGGNLLLSGSRAISSTYHVYAIFNPTTLQVDYGAILGVAGTAPNPTSVLPSGYTKYSKNPIFSLLTDASGNIRTGIAYFRSDGNYHFFYHVPVVDITGGVTITTERLQSVHVPRGLNYLSSNAVYINVAPASTGNNFSIGISNYHATTNRTYVAMATKNPTFIDDASAKPLPLLTNTSGELYFYTFASGNLSTHSLTTEAWQTLY